jgi:menaquinone-dependent protoporphyrinogen oxidase
MTDKILVAYSSAAGSTVGVAEAIGEALSSDGTTVDVLTAKEVGDLSPYHAVVLGSGVRAGKLYRETSAFVERHQAALSQMPVAYFVVCLTMMEDSEEHRCEADAYLDQLRSKVPSVEPVDVGLFAGVMDFKKVPFLLRLIVKAMKSKEGDFRDWDAIRDWATALKPKLVAA